MPDDLTKRGRPDRDRINVNEDHELRNWAQKFGVHPREVKRAVNAVGDHAAPSRTISAASAVAPRGPAKAALAETGLPRLRRRICGLSGEARGISM